MEHRTYSSMDTRLASLSPYHPSFSRDAVTFMSFTALAASFVTAMAIVIRLRNHNMRISQTKKDPVKQSSPMPQMSGGGRRRR